MDTISALDRARKAVNGSAALARLLTDLTGKRITGQAVAQWEEVPPLRVLEVERVTGIPRHELRPDMYPPPISAPVVSSPDSQFSGFSSSESAA